MRFLVLWAKGSAEVRLDAERIEECRRDVRNADRFRLTAAIEHARAGNQSGHRFERPRILPPETEMLVVYRHGGIDVRQRLDHFTDRYEPARLAVGQRLQNHSVHERK